MKKLLRISQTLISQAKEALDLPSNYYNSDSRTGRRRIFSLQSSFLGAASILLLLALLIIIAIFPSSVRAQSPTYSWAKSIGASGMQRGMTMVEDAQGNIFVAGEFQGTVDFVSRLHRFSSLQLRFYRQL
jgi:hypothetical protein